MSRIALEHEPMRRLTTTAVLFLFLSVPVCAQDMDLAQVLLPGENWELLGEGYKFTEGPAADADGNVFFTDVPNDRIYKIDTRGEVSLFVENSARTNGLMFGPDGRLYGCRNGERKIVAYAADGSLEIIASDVDSNDIVVSSTGAIYFTDPSHGQVWYVSPNREKRVVAEGLKPNGVILWPDQSTLVVTDAVEPVLWTFRVEANGSLMYKERYYLPLRMVPGAKRTGSDGMTVDDEGRLYVATLAGIQMFDPIGRMGGVIARPHVAFTSNVVFGGHGFNSLYATSRDKVYRRKVKPVGTPNSLRAIARAK